jgi:uncharacterized membrane protein YtjA (UPF0391 family)
LRLFLHRFAASLRSPACLQQRNHCSASGLISQHGAWRWSNKFEVGYMMGWVITFLIVALVAGVLGFGGIAGASIEMAKIVFFIAIVLFLLSAVFGIFRGRNRI